MIPASFSVSLMELDRLGCDIKSSFTQVKKKCNRFVEKQNEVAILFVTSYNCFLLSVGYQFMPVQILGVLRLASPGMIHMKEKAIPVGTAFALC